ncbi:hypothetical protein TRFO_41408 [Tritrichomonas foetus]|uniref:Beige/BEACH domain containing protein n=1 Tax=Tritrichomonas foetus TaxID=1144522 RepID=A0A1J4L4S0_9EUKA|nr:hypothetical protein TRFO_41408 [Tritrichomonas foetus]|eukprot:OHT16980.1 hypothetical protein TRFO_41408 [Tritrichomonas foetus]
MTLHLTFSNFFNAMIDFLTRNDINIEFDKKESVRQVKTAINQLNTEKTLENVNHLYLNLLTIFEGFLVDETDERVLKYVSLITSDKIYEYIPLICSSILSLVQTLRILPKIGQITNRVPPTIIFKLFIAAQDYSKQYKQIISLTIPYFSQLFVNQSFVSKFIEKNGLIEILKKIVINPDVTDETQDFIYHIIRFFPSVDPQIEFNFFSEFSSLVRNDLVPVENKLFAAKFLSMVFVQFSKQRNGVSTQLVNSGALQALQFLLKNIEILETAKILSMLINSNDDNPKVEPNLIICHWICQICSFYSYIPDIAFPLLTPYIMNKNPLIEELDQSFPIILWFTDFIRPLNDLVEIIRAFDNYYPESLKKFLPSLFRENHSLNDKYSDVFRIVMNQIDNQLLTYKDLSLFGFVESFILNPTPDILMNLYKIECFEETIKNVFVESSSDLQISVLNSLLYSNLPIDTCSSLLVEKPTISNIKTIISDTKDRNSQVILLSLNNAAHLKSNEIYSNFIDSGGLQWINSIDFTFFVPILGSVVSKKKYKKVDDFIISLPKTHKLFSMPYTEIEKVVYGMNSMLFRPIRVPSLFHLIPIPNYIDPYNAYVLGTSEYASNGYDCPLINQIGNRYIKPQFINMLLSRPYEIGRFCDLQYDHFPLFQFFRGSDTLHLQENYFAISFWVKFHKTNDTQFFTADHLKMFVSSGNSLIAVIDDKKYSFDVSLGKWNHVYIYLENAIGNHKYKISLKINEEKDIKTHKTIPTFFTFASFEYSDTGLLFIGSAIRMFTNMVTTENMELYSNGPGWLEPVHLNCSMFTPYNFQQSRKTGTIPQNCYSVPYFGFPFHHISQKRLSDLFTFLDNSQTNEQFDSIFHTLLCINKITVRNISDFWMRMLRSIKKTSFITKSFIHDAVESISGMKNDEWTLSSILFDNELWKFVDNELLVEILFDEFQNTTFSSIPEFELFLTTIILQNPKSQKIVDIFLKNHELLPKLINWIISFLGTAHFMDSTSIYWELINARCEMDIQHTIIDSLITFLNRNTIKQVTKWLPFKNLCGLIVVSPKQLASHFYELLTAIEKISPGFIDVNDALIAALAPLSAFPIVWQCTNELHKSFNQKDKFLPIILTLIWATSLSTINALSIGKDFTSKVNSYYENGLSLCLSSIPALFQSKKCMIILTYLFPLICNYPILLQLFTSNGTSDNFHIDASGLSEASEPIIGYSESNDIHSTKIPDLPPTPAAPNFLLDLVSSVLSSFGFEAPKSCAVKGNKAVNWLKASQLSHLIVTILFQANQSAFQQLFPSLFLSVPFFHRNRGKFFIPVLTSSILHELDSNFRYMKIFMNYLNFCITEKCFITSGASLLTDMFDVMKISNSRQKYSEDFVNMFFGLISYCDRNTYFDIIEVLIVNIIDFSSIIIDTNTKMPFFYSLYLMSKERPNNFRNFILKISIYFTSSADQNIIGLIETMTMGPHSSAFSLIDDAFKQRLNKFSSIHKNVANEIMKSRFVSEISNISKAVNIEKYTSNKHWYQLAISYKQNLKILDSTFMLIEETMQWERFMASIHDTAISESTFNPKCYHLSPRCLRCMVPQVLTPSPYAPSFIEKKKDKILLDLPSPLFEPIGSHNSSTKKIKQFKSDEHVEMNEFENLVSYDEPDQERNFPSSAREMPRIWYDPVIFENAEADGYNLSYSQHFQPSSALNDISHNIFTSEEESNSLIIPTELAKTYYETKFHQNLRKNDEKIEGDFKSNEKEENEKNAPKNVKFGNSPQYELDNDDIQSFPSSNSNQNYHTNKNVQLEEKQKTSQKTFNTDIIWQYRHHIKNLFNDSKPSKSEFMSLFFSLYGKKELQYYSSCKLERHSTRIPSIVFIYPKNILILTYSTIKDEDISLLKISDSKSLHIFLESIYLGHWGETRLFASHIVINIPLSSLIYITQQANLPHNYLSINFSNNLSGSSIYSSHSQLANSEYSFEFWSFMSGNFILTITNEHYSQFKKEMEKINGKIEKELPKRLLLPNNSPEAFILEKNNKYGRSFADLKRYPFFPGFIKNKNIAFPNEIDTEVLLSSVLPFSYSDSCDSTNSNTSLDSEIKVEVDFESIPANYYFNSEFLMKYTCSKLSNENFFGSFQSQNIYNSYNTNNLKNQHRNRNKNKFSKLNSSEISPTSSMIFNQNVLVPPQLNSNPNTTYANHPATISSTNCSTANISSNVSGNIPGATSPTVSGTFSSNSLSSLNSNLNNNSTMVLRRRSCMAYKANISKKISDSADVAKSIQKVTNFRKKIKDEAFVNEWISRHFQQPYQEKLQFVPTPSPIQVTDFNLFQFCQLLSLTATRHKAPHFLSDGVSLMPIHTKSIRDSGIVYIDQRNMMLTIMNSLKIVRKTDHYFTFASSIDVSENGLFMSIDFEFGLTRVWRIKYYNNMPYDIDQLSDFSWNACPTSLLSGTHFICASKLETEVILWEINTGTIHRILKFGCVVTAIAMDDEFGAVWIATSSGYGYFYSIMDKNWQKLIFLVAIIKKSLL